MTIPTDATPSGLGGSEPAVLSFQDLEVQFATDLGEVRAVNGISMEVHPGEVLAVVGESGSGKSVTSMTALGLLPKNARIGGVVRVTEKDVRQLDARRLRQMRGKDVAMVFQEPQTALNPVLTIGDQLVEALQLHGVAYGNAAKRRAADLLAAVGIPEPARRLKQYPHELSGGQRQRVVIAMALSCDPKVIIADEPTTALDVTVQADILDLLRSLKEKLNTGILLITHNMGVVADMADRVAVMYQGDVVEVGSAEQVLVYPQHEYTRRLLDAVPRLGAGRAQLGIAAEAPPIITDEVPALEVKNAVVEYHRLGKPSFRAAEDVSFTVHQGEIVGLVGESGSGKSTMAKCALGILPPTSGTVAVYGEDFNRLKRKDRKALQKRIGVVFQDPAASLNPRVPVGDIIAEPMVIHKVGTKTERQRRVYELLEAVELPRAAFNRFPHELSGGQRQRVSIARALSLDPELLVADEPTSALDVSVQASVLKMFMTLQAEFRFACLFVSHDLAVIDMLAHHVVVMENGRVVEQGLREQVLHEPREEYTKRLLAAAPVPNPEEQRRRREQRHAMLAAFGDKVVEIGDVPHGPEGP
ncbi:ABC transporter ATP-binding protein [Phytoactinopolyspora halotolerans]|uniref:ABC transporter ATP-binding protein n=1 Tax=Phytoactinopolyspora halotolerans TaxID=1981512 RepID=A0A6L9S7G1_9ACTN|nr:ABC transporter ATP-binding protein [Phytoactinopolyspora halotolerans]NEE00512.1 ABC transporter ATP-binding protein [Phytoactinopolyspora halotolerans]